MNAPEALGNEKRLLFSALNSGGIAHESSKAQILRPSQVGDCGFLSSHRT